MMCVRTYVCMFSIFLIFFIFHSIRTILIVISRSLSHRHTHTHTCIQNCVAQIKFFAVCVAAAAALSTFRFVFLSCCVCSAMQKETEEIIITYTFFYSNHNACVESFVIIVIVACNIKDTFCCIFKTKKCEMVKNRKRRRHDVRPYNQCDRTQTT